MISINMRVAGVSLLFIAVASLPGRVLGSADQYTTIPDINDKSSRFVDPFDPSYSTPGPGAAAAPANVSNVESEIPAELDHRSSQAADPLLPSVEIPASDLEMPLTPPPKSKITGEKKKTKVAKGHGKEDARRHSNKARKQKVTKKNKNSGKKQASKSRSRRHVANIQALPIKRVGANAQDMTK
ncbi:MAG: hypothetical protein C5B49_11025 [Bdellovibrio sp.]|nr:MAG: hypothetical protein C5B49_11025 [Bdellovibrio sp.]